MNRREWLRNATLIAAGAVALDQLEVLERLAPRRLYFAGWRAPWHGLVTVDRSIKADNWQNFHSIQAAIDSREKVGGTVRLAPAEYHVSEGIVIRGSGICFDGYGAKLTCQGGTAITVKETASDMVLQNITIEGCDTGVKIESDFKPGLFTALYVEPRSSPFSQAAWDARAVPNYRRPFTSLDS